MDWLDWIDEQYEEEDEGDDDRLIDDLVCYQCASVPGMYDMGIAVECDDGQWLFYCSECIKRWHKDGTFDQRLRDYKRIEPMRYYEFMKEKKGILISEPHGHVVIVEINEEVATWN